MRREPWRAVENQDDGLLTIVEGEGDETIDVALVSDLAYATQIVADHGAAGELAALREALLPIAERLARDDETNERLGVERWSDEATYVNTMLTNGLLRRVRAAASPAAPDGIVVGFPCDLCGEQIEGDHETWTLTEDGEGHQFRTHNRCAADVACARCAARWPLAPAQQVADLLDLIHEHGSAELRAMADELVRT